MPKDRCSFEVVYAKNDVGGEEIEHVVVRGGLSDAAVTLTVPQIYNLARLLDIVQNVAERIETTRHERVNGNGNGNGGIALPRPQAVKP